MVAKEMKSSDASHVHFEQGRRRFHPLSLAEVEMMGSRPLAGRVEHARSGTLSIEPLDGVLPDIEPLDSGRVSTLRASAGRQIEGRAEDARIGTLRWHPYRD